MAARVMVTPAQMRMWVSSSCSMPPIQSFKQTTSPGMPSSGANTLVPAPKIAGLQSNKADVFRILESSSLFLGNAMTSAPPPMRKEVCFAMGSFIRSSISGSKAEIFC